MARLSMTSMGREEVSASVATYLYRPGIPALAVCIYTVAGSVKGCPAMSYMDGRPWPPETVGSLPSASAVGADDRYLIQHR